MLIKATVIQWDLDISDPDIARPRYSLLILRAWVASIRTIMFKRPAIRDSDEKDFTVVFLRDIILMGVFSSLIMPSTHANKTIFSQSVEL